VGRDTPKWLIDVGGRTLADRQLEGISRAGDAVASIRVVVGHAAEAIEAELKRRPEPVRTVRNPEFAEINNWWSLLRAFRELPDDGPVAVINADLLADPTHVAALLEEGARGTADGMLAIDLERELTDESMKVSRGPAGTIDRIGKVDVDEPAGEYVGMLMARGATLRRMREVLESFVDRPESANEWYERAVGITAAAGVSWRIWPMPTSGWVEIDDEDDLVRAETLVATR
jgi:choline kinase